jgi:putative ATPase
VDDLRHLRKEALGRRALGRRTIIFMDEIHRFNKAQQDALLPDVEDGLYILIGTTTHNPYFAITGALLSRSTIFQYHSLTKEGLLVILKRALQDPERGLGKENIQADDDALETLAEFADGDGRAALTGLELCYLTLETRTGPLKLTRAHVTESLQQKKLRYDRDEDEHYDTISAFIKSVRGSDPDAAIYWLAKMLAGGEDPRFISRRLMILASEDIGNAEPMGILVASAGMHVVETIGMPEAQITLAQVTAFLACSPKSNASYMAIAGAMKDVEEKPLMEVPKHLKDSHYKGAKSLGHGEGYEYPHSFEGAHVEQAYIPEPRKYYIPTDRGVEAKFKEYLERIRSANPHP